MAQTMTSHAPSILSGIPPAGAAGHKRRMPPIAALRRTWSRIAAQAGRMNDMTFLSITAVAGAMVTGAAASAILLSGPDRADLPDPTWPEAPPLCRPLPALPERPLAAVPDGLDDVTGPLPVCMVMLIDAD